MSSIDKKLDVQHVEDLGAKDAPLLTAIDEQANLATDQEHSLTIAQALKTHKKAVLWSMAVSGTIIMEGYDNILISSFYAYPAFQKKYGEEFTPGNYQLTGPWQVALSIASSCGIIISLFVNGLLIERFGHRRVIMCALVILAGFIFVTFFAKSLPMLLAGQILCGLPWGVFATMGPIYSSEVAPLALRGHLTAYVNMCWAIGQFIAAGVLKGLVNNTTEWSYRIPFAIQWVWCPILFVITYFAPDSPWWLVRKGRYEDAEKAVKRFTNKSIHDRAKDSVAMMIRTTELEKAQESIRNQDRDLTGWRAYIKLFEGSDRRRTEAACIGFAGQVLSGSTFAYSPSYFFSQAGLDANNVYKLNLGTTGIAFTGTFCSWFLLTRFGRRTIYVTGLGVLTCLLLLIGILAFPAANSAGVKWAQAGITMIWVATYALTIGPMAFTIVSEISSTRLRAQSIALARNTYNLASLISHIVEPYLINPRYANLKGKTAFFWFGTALPTFIWSYFRLPETRGRTYEELDIMFERNVPSRKFASYVIEKDEAAVLEQDSLKTE